MPAGQSASTSQMPVQRPSGRQPSAHSDSGGDLQPNGPPASKGAQSQAGGQSAGASQGHSRRGSHEAPTRIRSLGRPASSTNPEQYESARCSSR
jgi:hypothetical protein